MFKKYNHKTKSLFYCISEIITLRFHIQQVEGFFVVVFLNLGITIVFFLLFYLEEAT